MDGMGWDWIGSPGGRGYRAPYGANKFDNGSVIIQNFQLQVYVRSKQIAQGYASHLNEVFPIKELIRPHINAWHRTH